MQKGNHPIKNTLLESDILATGHIETLSLLRNYCDSFPVILISVIKHTKEKYGKVQQSQNI